MTIATLFKVVNDLVDDLSLNLDRSPWCRSLTPVQWADWLTGEVAELKVELDNADYAPPPDKKKIEDELSDCYWCLITLTLTLMRRGWVEPVSVFRHAARKLRARKPWIFDGSSITCTAEEEHQQYKIMKEKLKARTT